MSYKHTYLPTNSPLMAESAKDQINLIPKSRQQRDGGNGNVFKYFGYAALYSFLIPLDKMHAFIRTTHGT